MWKSLLFPYKGWLGAPSQVETARSKNFNIFANVHDRDVGRSLAHRYAGKKVPEHFFIDCNKFLVLLNNRRANLG